MRDSIADKLKGLDIQESLIPAEGKMLQMLAHRAGRPGMRIVEVGSWKGFSTVYLAEVAAHWQGYVFAVDHWKGSPGTWNVPIAQSQDVLSTFRHNVAALGYERVVKPMVMDSVTAASVFRSRSLDVVFVDGDHRYSGVRADIEAWLPKIRIGGILCGHDGSTSYSSQPDRAIRAIENSREVDYLPEYQLHPGVTKALHDCLGDRQKLAGNTCIWYWRKTVEELIMVNTKLRQVSAACSRLEYKALVLGGWVKQRIERKAS